jgi:hypothetical protein
LSDELKGRLYAVIETPTGHAYHVPLDARSAEQIRPNDMVSVTTRPESPIRPIDRHIVDVARSHGGVYVSGPQSDESTVRSADYRLRELGRLGLVTPVGPNQWSVPPNLLEQLEVKHRAAPPRHRLFIRKDPLSLADQIRYEGPVWLDRVDLATTAPYGLGAELRAPLRDRREVLRQFGVVPANRPAADLREIERRAAGREIAARSGQTFVSRTPVGFRGRIQVHEAPGGASYAIISDGLRFAVLDSGALRVPEGKSVTVTRDPKGRLVVHPDPDRGLGS